MLENKRRLRPSRKGCNIFTTFSSSIMRGKIKDKILLYKLKTRQNSDDFTVLYDKYVKQIYRFVFFKVSNKEEAEDITSEVFLKAWNYIQDNKEIKSFSGLLYRLARNCVVDLYRAKASRGAVPINEQTDMSDGGEWYEDLNNRSEAQEILKALKKLKQEYQEVLTLKYVDELKVEEIAEITGKGKIAVRVTLYRALKKLKFILAEK